MDAELTKSFTFSASYSQGSRNVGANYVFLVCTAALDDTAEAELEAVVGREIISKLHTNDFSKVDFLKGVGTTDAALLRAFWSRISGPLAGFSPRRISLQKDSRTTTTLYV